MQLSLRRFLILKKFRLTGSCGICNSLIVLDEESFMEDPRYIICWKCGTKYLVLSIQKKDKQNLSLQIIKDKQE
jgi:hypothetical protein